MNSMSARGGVHSKRKGSYSQTLLKLPLLVIAAAATH
jgi:hypothetical protein